MGLSRTVSEIDGDLCRKSHFSHPCVINAPAKGVPLELGIGARGQKTRMIGLPAGVEQATKNWEGEKISGSKRP